MPWRTHSTRFLLSLAGVMILAYVALVVLQRSTRTAPAPSAAVVAVDSPNRNALDETPERLPVTSRPAPDSLAPHTAAPNNVTGSPVTRASEPPETAIPAHPSGGLDEQGSGAAVARPALSGRPRAAIRFLLVDFEGNPIEGFVTLEQVEQEPNAAPASHVAIPEPAHQPAEGLIGRAYDVSGELARRFIWQKTDTDEEMMVVLEPHASIVGLLVDGARQPVTEARLDLQMPMMNGRWRGDIRSLAAAVVDDDGYFHFERVPVGSPLRIAASRGTFTGHSRPIRLTPGAVARAGQIVMTGPRPGSGLVQGRITDETGAPIADRSIQVRLGHRARWLRTDAAGHYLVTDLPNDRLITIEIEISPYGRWSRTTIPDDFACDFQLLPQGWNVIGAEAPPLFPAKWFNHPPTTLAQLRGHVVLLTFRDFQTDARRGLARMRKLLTEYGPQGLAIIVVYDHLPVTDPLAQDIVAGHLADLFEGTSIAGFLDAAPDLVADLMPLERPTVARAGATHWLYQVHARPAFFLIDRKGIVRYGSHTPSDPAGQIQRLLSEQTMSQTP